MENPKTPETLEAKNPDEKTPKEASGSSGVGENFSGLAPVSGISIEGNDKTVAAAEMEEVEKRTEVCEVEKGGLVKNDGFERVKEGKLESNMSPNDEEEENEAELGSVQSQSDGDLVDLGSNGNGGVEVKDLVQDEGTNEDKESDSNGIDSSREIEVSTEGISLFVEISGSPSRHTDKDVDEGNIFPLTDSKGSLKEEEDEVQGKEVDNRESEFSVGDIVWIQTKNQTWWPGKIHNPVDAPKYATRSGPGYHLLVGYYGISHFAWCCPSQLRPFHENFEQMSGKNGARIFLGAVEKAVDEFGRHVKLEMTCSCAPLHDQLSAGTASVGGGVLKPESQSGRLGEFSVTSFKPETFLERLKYAAEVVSMPHMLDFTVTRNRLSAFYRSIGHRQLPVHVLAERNETEEDKTNAAKEGFVSSESKKGKGFVSSESKKRKMKRDSEPEVEDDSDKVENVSQEKAGVENIAHEKVGVENIAHEKEGVVDKGFNLRERKKSRYLSYPYTNWEQKGAAGTEDPKDLKVTPEASIVAGQSNTLPLNSKCSGEKFWRKWYKRFTGGSHIPTGSELTNAASAELLCELRSAAVDCLHPKGNDNFNPVCWFLSRYRISLFHEESVENEVNGAEACRSGNNSQENSQAFLDKPKRKRTKKKENLPQGKDTIHSPNPIGSTATGVQGVNEIFDPSMGQDSVIIKKINQPNSARSKTKPLSVLSDVSISIATNGLSVRDALEIGPALKSNKAKQRKKKKGEKMNGDKSLTKQTTAIPDLNGSSAASSLLVDDPQAMNHVPSEVKTKRPKEMEKEAGLEESNANITAGLLDIRGNNAKPGTLFVDLRVPDGASVCKNNNYTTGLQFANDRLTIGLQLGEGEPRRKKRKRKEKAAPKNIPDLNGASAESNSVGKEMEEPNNGLTPPVKPKQKRGRKKRQYAALKYPRNISISWRPDMNPSYSRKETNGETMGTALLLSFAPGVPMPSRDDLVSMFCKFGPLKESETRFLKDPESAQIVFMRDADATEALKSIERNNLFGAALVNYRLHHLPAVSRAPETNRNSIATPSSSTQALSVAPPLDVIKHNLQMMTTMLEKSGDNLSPETRAKLESEIKGLLSKVSSMTGSCS
ncbi:hypothetical protein TIFTF001_015073 [Ficus carica]|uniref:PWWP domain-containing protein n=1 Tax=Ficus carica TaxID=3494 RepID=A0AA88A557_FICCA|nr:hypothetical protein TIFTF001_015073 [Ficus carica]